MKTKPKYKRNNKMFWDFSALRPNTNWINTTNQDLIADLQQWQRQILEEYRRY